LTTRSRTPGASHGEAAATIDIRSGLDNPLSDTALQIAVHVEPELFELRQGRRRAVPPKGRAEGRARFALLSDLDIEA